jgi:membrane protease YdiL (CAAX protease family)
VSVETAIVLALYLGVPFYGLGLYWFLTRQPLLPRQRHRLVAWGGAEVCLALLIAYLMPGVFASLLQQVDYFGLVDTPVLPRNASPADLTPLQHLSLLRQGLLAQAVATPFQVVLILLLFRHLSNTQPYQLGWTGYHFRANVTVGALAWSLATPLVYLTSTLVALLFKILVEGREEQHPLEKLVKAQGLPMDWVLLILLAVVAAPVTEELIYRGVLQKWLARRPWGGDAAMFAAFVMALLGRSNQLASGLYQGDLPLVLYELGPVLLVLALVPGLLWVDRIAPRWFPTPRRHPSLPSSEGSNSPNGEASFFAANALEPKHSPRLPGQPDNWLTRILDRYAARVSQPVGLNSAYTARAWYGTAVLFAAVHSGTWPSPVPLVVLAFMLGWLAYRTQSLIGPMVFHALFNGVTCAALIFNSPAQPPEKPKGKPTTTAVSRLPSTSTSSGVPESR